MHVRIFIGNVARGPQPVGFRPRSSAGSRRRNTRMIVKRRYARCGAQLAEGLAMTPIRGVSVLLLFAACQMEMATTEDTATLRHTLSWHQEPGNEIDDCHVFKLDNVSRAEVDRITVKFPPGSHHVHIYRSDTPDPTDHVDGCWNGIDWLRWHLVLGVQSEQMD